MAKLARLLPLLLLAVRQSAAAEFYIPSLFSTSGETPRQKAEVAELAVEPFDANSTDPGKPFKDWCVGGKPATTRQTQGRPRALWDPSDPRDLREVWKTLPGLTEVRAMWDSKASSKGAPDDTHSLKRKSCAVVGNSGSLLKAEFGRVIDKHDVVVRLNHAPAGVKDKEWPYTDHRRLAKHVGEKTTFRVLNLMWSRRYSSGRLHCMAGENLCKPGGEPYAGTLVMTRAPTSYCKRMMERGRKVLCQEGKVMRSARKLFYPWFAALMCQPKEFRPAKASAKVISSGFAAWYMMLSLCGKVTLYGFGSGLGGGSAGYKYFVAGKQSMYDGHSMDAELLLAEAFQAAGKLKICHYIKGRPAHNKSCS